jgi:hypothetical protein
MTKFEILKFILQSSTPAENRFGIAFQELWEESDFCAE